MQAKSSSRARFSPAFPFTLSAKHRLSLWPTTCNCPCMPEPISSRLEQYMDLLSARQKLVASNIANIDTPGYKTRDIDFQFEYMSMLKGSNPSMVEVPGLVVKNDGNNVS